MTASRVHADFNQATEAYHKQPYEVAFGTLMKLLNHELKTRLFILLAPVLIIQKLGMTPHDSLHCHMKVI